MTKEDFYIEIPNEKCKQYGFDYISEGKSLFKHKTDDFFILLNYGFRGKDDFPSTTYIFPNYSFFHWADEKELSLSIPYEELPKNACRGCLELKAYDDFNKIEKYLEQYYGKKSKEKLTLEKKLPFWITHDCGKNWLISRIWHYLHTPY